jgi:hypothetical protein
LPYTPVASDYFSFLVGYSTREFPSKYELFYTITAEKGIKNLTVI